MADVPLRISSLAATAETAAVDDYVALDRSTWAAARKILASNLIGSLVLNGNIAVVDSVNGGTGTLGSFVKSYSAPGLAQTDATSSYCIEVYPGAFTATLGKNGIDWQLMPGVTITGDGAAAFTDGGSAMTYAVAGTGIITGTGTAGGFSTIGAVESTNASSVLTVQALSISQNLDNSGSNVAAVYGVDGYLSVTADVIESGSVIGSATLWWTNGEMHVHATKILASHYGLIIDGSNAPTGDCFIQTDWFVAPDGAILDQTANANLKLWLDAQLIQSDNGAAITKTGTGKIYVRSSKIVGPIAGDASTTNVDLRDGQSWINTQKITGTYGSGLTISGGTHFITSQQLEDLGHLTQGVNISGGTLTLNDVTLVAAAGNGVNISGGTLRLINCRIDTTAVAGGNPIVVSGGTLVLQSCVLLAHSGRESVTAASGKTITNYGSVANTAKSVNITVNVQAILVDANVI